jgi:hypothetical protein
MRECGNSMGHGELPMSVAAENLLSAHHSFLNRIIENPSVASYVMTAGTTEFCMTVLNIRREPADGRGDRIRTCDIYVPNVALYQSELHPEGGALV